MNSPVQDPTPLTTRPDSLYSLLPPVFRQADIAQGYPLLALSGVFDAIRGEIEAAIAALEQAWFIETCPDALVPLIGAQLGLDLSTAGFPEHRALIANALGIRRRKGTALALPKLIRGSCGWRVLYAADAQTPASAWPLTDVPATSADGADQPKPNAGILRVWRLPVFAQIGRTPKQIGTSLHYFCHPAGLPLPLGNVPNTPLDWQAAPPITALPAALTVDMLNQDLNRHRRLWGAEGPANSLLYGSGRGLCLRLQYKAAGAWETIGPSRMRAATIGPGPQPPDYPVLLGQPIVLANLAAATVPMTLTLGDAVAQLEVAVPAAPATIDLLVTALADAIANATATPGKTVSEADIRAIVAGANGSQLLLIPTSDSAAPLTITVPDQGIDPLNLVGSARLGIAAATVPLDAKAIAALTDAVPSEPLLRFIAPRGELVTITLPIAADPATPAGIAAAIAMALPGSTSCAAGDQIVIVPAPAPPPKPVPQPSALAWTLGLVPAPVLDPEHGLFSLPAAWGVPAAASIDFGQPLSGAIGGVGSTARPALAATPDGGDVNALERALGKGTPFAMALQGSAQRQISARTVSAATSIEADAGAFPNVTIGGTGQLALAGAAAAPQITLAGIFLQGNLALTGAALALRLTDMTILPATGSSALAPVAADPAPTGTIDLIINGSIVGPITLDGFVGTARVADSIVAQLPAIDTQTGVITTDAGCALTLERSTVAGALTAKGGLSAHDSLLFGIADAAAPVAISNSAVTALRIPPGSDLSTGPGAAIAWCPDCKKPRAIDIRQAVVVRLTIGTDDLCACGSETAPVTRLCGGDAGCPASCAGCPLDPINAGLQVLGAPLVPVAADYPAANFAALDYDQTADNGEVGLAQIDVVRTAASNHDEVGARNRHRPTAHALAFRVALRDGLLHGCEPQIIFES